jgi:hypothetical protein
VAYFVKGISNETPLDPTAACRDLYFGGYDVTYNRKNLQQRLLAYSTAAVVATAGAAFALPAVALETDGARDNDFDVVLESLSLTAEPAAPAATNCSTVVPDGRAQASLLDDTYFAVAIVSTFSAASGTLNVFASNGAGTQTSTFFFSGHTGSNTYEYNTVSDFGITTVPFLQVEFRKATNQFCISGFTDPNAITGIEATAAPASQAAPAGLATLAAACLAAVSAGALWLRGRDKTSASPH